MKAVIFEGSTNKNDTIESISHILTEQLNNAHWNVETIVLRQKRIAGCAGCFGCWIQTPGVCVIDDDGREIAKCAAQADLLVYLTPVTFGGYSSELKKAVDRTLPILLPYFTLVKGEVHHKMRYKRRQRLAVIGVETRSNHDSARTFEKLVERNAINIHSPAYGSSIFNEGFGTQETQEQIGLLLKNVGVVA